MKINWKIRFNRQNALYIAQILMSVAMPVLAYFGLAVKDITTWNQVGATILAAISNPYVVGLMVVSFFNATTDPTTKGIGDSNSALTYTAPNSSTTNGGLQ